MLYNWDDTSSIEPQGHKPSLKRYSDVILFLSGALASFLVFSVLYSSIEQTINREPLLVAIIFGPSVAIGFLYGRKIAMRVMEPDEVRGPLKTKLTKVFLYIFVIGSLFSSVNFALNGGSISISAPPLDKEIIPWLLSLLTANGGTTFLIVSSITLMGSATKRVVGFTDGPLNKTITFVGAFFFFITISLSLTHTNPSASQVYLYAFYQMGIVTGVLYGANKATARAEGWDSSEW